MKVYTKSGDKGKTSLIGGARVPKYDNRIEAYGTVDELISFTALLKDSISNESVKNTLLWIQDRLMTCASILATDCDSCKKIPIIYESDIERLEKEIDLMEESLKPLKSFILPGGNVIVSYSHICRSICRRTERLTVKLIENVPFDEKVNKYLNRLSDYFFVLSRFLAKETGANEITWVPKF
ncbi:MAG: ATP:cob(I)alamin adenosyltransferase [Bacteroidetes bacterium GWA2_30_7]|nr:MAG: ATP:cob(I)alamin adenosyltransferase [Bacteroidetes bacterium GWA2_30_7]